MVSMVIGVQSQQAREWLECRLKKVIERTLGGIARQPVEVGFVVMRNRI